MRTELWRSDPFSEKKESMIDTIETDYPLHKGDLFVVTRGGGRRRYRVIHVEIEIADEGLKREVLALEL